MVRDNKRIFDEVGLIALPYLVYAENESFRVKLANKLAQITHHYLRQSDMQLFPNAVEGIMNMIEEYRNTAGTENVQTIDMYAAEISTMEDRFIQLSEKLDAHIKSHNMERIEKRRRGKSKKDTVSEPQKEQVEISTISSKSKQRPTRFEYEHRIELLKNYLKANGEINNQKCREICNVSTNQASRLLRKLEKDDFVERIGLASDTKYIIKN